MCRASVKQTPVPPPGRGGTWEKVINLFSELRGDTRGFTQRRRQRYELPSRVIRLGPPNALDGATLD